MNAAVDFVNGAMDLLANRIQGVPLINVRPKELSSKIKEALESQGVCIHILTLLPRSFLQGNDFVFFDGAEARVRICEVPDLNSTGYDCYQLIEEVALALHWKNPGGILAHPLQLAPRPVELREDAVSRIVDVVFEAVYQINR